MSQHLNRLNAEESVEWDEAFEKFCETGQWEEQMKVYLVETKRKCLGLEAISIQTNFEKAVGLVGDSVGLITELVVDEVYPEGIGVCNHWHFDPNEGEDNES